MSKYRIVFGKPYYNVWNIQEKKWWGWKTIGWEASRDEARYTLSQIEASYLGNKE